MWTTPGKQPTVSPIQRKGRCHQRPYKSDRGYRIAPPASGESHGVKPSFVPRQLHYTKQNPKSQMDKTRRGARSWWLTLTYQAVTFARSLDRGGVGEARPLSSSCQETILAKRKSSKVFLCWGRHDHPGRARRGRGIPTRIWQGEAFRRESGISIVLRDVSWSRIGGAVRNASSLRDGWWRSQSRGHV